MPAAPISVLIVDDDRTVGMMLRSLVRRTGQSLAGDPMWVATGAAAMEAVDRQRFDLVLLDFRLPDTDGLTVLAHIQQIPAERRPVVIMLTGSGNETVAVEAMKCGAKDYLLKNAVSFPAMQQSIAAALERRRLENELVEANEELRRRHDQMNAELAMARQVQQAFLPQRASVFPVGAAPGDAQLAFCHHWIPSSEVAGDFFQVIEASDTSVGVLVCDVMGHGVRAALITALVRGLVEELKIVASAPDLFLSELNRSAHTLLSRTNELVYATAVYVVFDTARQELRFANAAHPPPLHLRRAAGTVDLLTSDGEPPGPLGLFPDSVYTTTKRALAPGDAVFLFTDGLSEAENSAGEQFGVARLRETLAKHPAEPRERLCLRLLDAVTEHAGPAGAGGFADDVCLVAAGYRD